MKTINPLCKCLARSLVTLAVAGLVWLPHAVPAQETGSAKGGATKLIQLKPLKTAEDVAALQPGDTVVMSCPKCKDSWMTVVENPTKPGAATDPKGVMRHECPGCATKIVTEGHGKTKTDKLVHVCKQCGSEDAFCCVMKKGAGPTPGMTK